jgi:signal transduction histidine kinase
MQQLFFKPFKIRYLLSMVFYLIAVVAVLRLVNIVGVKVWGLGFLSWWPMGQSKLFGLGGQPEPVLSVMTSGLDVALRVPGLDKHLAQHWLTEAGLSLLTIVLFLTILGTLRRMLRTVDVHQPFDVANIRRVQFIMVIILFEMLVVDYWRTQSMAPVKTLVNQMGEPLLGTNTSYVNADVYAYILLLLLLTLLAVFRRGVDLHSQQSELEKQLYQKRKLEAVGTMASGIAHDFNNMLTSVIGYAEIAKSESDPQGRDFAIGQVLDASYRAKRLTQQIRAIGSQNHAVEQHELIDLKIEIEDLLVSMAPAFSADIQVVKHWDSLKRYEVYADPTKIYQLLLNLCTNALQAIGYNSGQLSIGIEAQTWQQQAGFRLSVKDSGCGMNEQQLEPIFEPYYTTRQKTGGTGLGLSMCYSIVEGHGGHIKVSSEVNKGSCFSVWLPCAASVPVPSGEVVKTKDLRILLVDDDLSIVALAKRRLTAFGYNITAFGNSDEAHQAFVAAPQNFDLVICDWHMPKMSGSELAQAIGAVAKDKPVIVITAMPEKVTFDHANVSIRNVISKPIAFSELNAVIEALFDPVL